MKRAWSMYFATFVVFGLGLAAVLRYGRNLHAPDDLSGAWTIVWNDPVPEGHARADRLRIEQSGRYLVLHFGADEPLSLELAGGRALGERESPAVAELRGARASVRLGPRRDAESFELALSATSTHTGLVRRAR
jgi:hypothetical protein